MTLSLSSPEELLAWIFHQKIFSESFYHDSCQFIFQNNFFFMTFFFQVPPTPLLRAAPEQQWTSGYRACVHMHKPKSQGDRIQAFGQAYAYEASLCLKI